ncbi:alpha/beta fold hydrolase [Pseudonocardia sp. DSM 110487]|uniref:alpha/beta fold hydrolase n=1 Tax=Pseudonocardia sp. DSM 110487 TaxID=2865833 RepID=UPI001C6A7254|nr:alpha/beta fold hydrolase [Pseudonocardia sp. DSM 110487]QYN34198.1 alpha/beta fold hydrolase [Pseudonocardia sp. DSM 110487]
MTTFVLVHGGWHGAWCWRRVTPLLTGHDVHCPTLTGGGDRAHLARPDTGLADHVADVVAVLELDDLRDVVLVGHSSGGAVITGVAQRCPERLRELVYLDAFVPAPGQSVFDLLPAVLRERFLGLVDGSGRIVLDWEAAMDGWALTAAADRDWVRPRLRPFPVGAVRDPLPLDPVPELPRHYIHCTVKPGGDSFAGFADAARTDPAWRFDELETGHDPMVTTPAALAAVLSAERQQIHFADAPGPLASGR